MDPLTDSDISKIKSDLSKNRYFLRDICFLEISTNTGFRLAELLSMTVASVAKFWPKKINDKVLVMAKNMKGKTKSRAVILNDKAKEAIQNYLESWNDMYQERIPLEKDSWLFPSQRGRGENAIGSRQAIRIQKKAAEGAQITKRVATHSGRKTFATKMHNLLGKDINATRAALGHSSVKNTQMYLATNMEEIDDAIKKL